MNCAFPGPTATRCCSCCDAQNSEEEVEWEDYWNPKLYVENAIGELKSSTSRCVEYDAAGLATVCETRLIGGTFFEFMELNKFPFDSQVISFLYMYISTRHDSDL